MTSRSGGAADRRTALRWFGLPAVVVALSLAIAAVTLLIGADLRFDAQGWVHWGRQIALGHESFSTADYPSWKPLPALITTPLAFTGSAAPTLTLMVLRAAGIAALGATALTARRLGGPVAALVAAGALALTPTWWRMVSGGAIEPLLVALALAAFARHRAGRPGQAIAFLCAVALGREEALALVLLYGLVLARRDPRWALIATAAAGAVAAAWLGGDWIGSGSPTHGSTLAKQAADAHADGAESFGAAAQAVTDLFPLPVWALAAAGAVVALREADRRIGVLAAAAAVWIGIDLLLAAAGYPIQPRFLFVSAAALAVIAGVGAAVLLRALRTTTARAVAEGVS